MAFVQEIGRIAEAQGHHPEIDVRYRAVLVRSSTFDAGDSVTEKDEILMQVIGAASRRYV